jgi:hypothetical protein
MRRLTSAAALLTILLTVNPAPCRTSRKAAAFEIDRPTIIAFFPSDTKSQSKNSDADDSLSDFQLYAASARQPLQNAGVELEEVYAREFQIALDGKTTNFRPPKAEPGYYFAMPGRKPRIEYGVMNDSDILRVAREYFGNAVKQ